MNKTIKKIMLITLIATMLVAPSMALFQAHAAPAPNWNVTGNWIFYNTSTVYPETSRYVKSMSLTELANGVITGSGNNVPAGHLWTVAGSVYGDSITFTLTYSTLTDPNTGTPYVATFQGTIDSSGHMSGTWFDTAFGDSGVWATIEGFATPENNYVPPGNNVVVNPDPNVSLTFDTVTGAGTATVAVSTAPPEGFPPLPGVIGPYYDIHVTATFSGKVKVCITYDATGLSLRQEKKLRLYTSDGVLPVGDVNHDGIVDVKDLLIVALALGSASGKSRWNPSADLNSDGKVDVKDLCVVLTHFGDSSWVDITLSIDTTNNVICGVTDHFSGFGIH